MRTVGSLKEIREAMKNVSTDETFIVAGELNAVQFEALIGKIESSGDFIVLECEPNAVPKTVTVGCRT